MCIRDRSYNVTATVTGLTAASFALTNTVGAAATVTATSGDGQSKIISTAFDNALVTTVTDAGGNPVPNVTVNFSATTASSGATATLSVASAVTNAAGVVSVAPTSNNKVGSYNVTATVTGLTAASFALTNTVGAMANLAATGGTPQSTAASTSFSTSLQATVTDAGGNPCLLYTSPSPRDLSTSRMPSSA